MLKIGSRTYRKARVYRNAGECETCAFGDLPDACFQADCGKLEHNMRETFLSRFRAALRDEIARDYPYEEHDTMGR
jgi:hypothetical protein